MRQTRTRLLLLLLALPVLTAVLVYSLLHDNLDRALASEQARFGQALTGQLAENIAQLVVETDLVSLNVVATRLADNDPIRFVAIYDDNNQLIAQSGRERHATNFYNAEITFQDSVVGFARVGISTTARDETLLLLWFGVALILYVTGAWYISPALVRWLNHEPGQTAANSDEVIVPALQNESEGTLVESLLVVRLRPARHLSSNFDRFFQAARLYGGLVEQTTPEELVVHFEDTDAVFLAACSGLLIQQVAEKLPGRISFGGTLEVVTDGSRKARKSASYLASISNGDLLVAGGDEMLGERVQLESFHHALVESGELLRITGLKDQSLLDAQADQLIQAGA